MDKNTIDVEAEKSQWANQPFKAKPTWFFYREDGELFTADENYAYELMKPAVNGKKRFDLIGVSDMKEYERIVSESKTKNIEAKTRIDALYLELRRYEDTFIKFKYEQLMDEDDERLIKLQGRVDAIQAQIDTIKEGLHNTVNEVHQEGLRVEIERAKLNQKMPKSNDIVELRGAKLGGSDNIAL